MKGRKTEAAYDELSHPEWINARDEMEVKAKEFGCEYFDVRSRIHSQIADSAIRDSSFPEDKRRIFENIVGIKAWFLAYEKYPALNRTTGERDKALEGIGYTNDFPFKIYNLRPSVQKSFIQRYLRKLGKSALKHDSARVYAEDLVYSPEAITQQEIQQLGT